MIRYARWWCKLPGCRMWGLGGPNGWLIHQNDHHQQWDATARLQADVTFGFTPDIETEIRA